MFPLNARILVVDDMQSLREVLKVYLRRLGYNNLTDAQDGQMAYQLLIASNTSQRPIELVICDWNMPKMNGLELLKVVRAVEAFKKLPFLMLTTESEKAKVLEAIASGVSNYLVKPVAETTLREKMRMVWEKAQANP